jgi:hypothetical protein
MNDATGVVALRGDIQSYIHSNIGGHTNEERITRRQIYPLNNNLNPY